MIEGDVEMMRAMYPDDVTVYAGEAVGKNNRARYSVVVVPTTEDADNHVRVTLHVTFRTGCRYPSQAPLLRVVADKGLSASLTKDLQARLEAQAAELARDGVPSGVALAGDAAEFLREHNDPALSMSEFDRMAQRKAADAKAARDAKAAADKARAHRTERQLKKKKADDEKERQRRRSLRTRPSTGRPVRPRLPGSLLRSDRNDL